MSTDLKLSISRRVVRISYVLLLLVIAGNLWLKNQAPVIYLIVLTPLIIFIPGLLAGSVRTLIWLGFVLLLYFAAAIYGIAKPEPQILDIAEVILTVILFCTAMYHARIRQVGGA